MRIGHLADTHLGFRRWSYTDTNGNNQRESDVYGVFAQAIDQMIERDVDVVIHAGDLFESYHPPTRALQVALDGFAQLREAGIPVVAIPGNHSTPRSTAAHVFGLLERFGIQTVWRGPSTVRIGDLAVTGVPHQHHTETFLEHLRAVRPDPKATFNVLVLHAGTEGLAGAGNRETGAIELDAELLDEGAEFDYVALGHLHSHFLPTRNAGYAGSLERLTFQDTAPKKGWIEVDLSAAGRRGFVKLREVTPRSCIQLSPVDASGCDDLLPLLEGAVAQYDLTEAMVRIPLVGVDRATWRNFDRAAWASRTDRALHVELDSEYASTAAGQVPGTPDLAGFLRDHAPKGLNAEKIIERAEGFVREAADELADE